jgi:hypothetical protein
MSAIVGDASVIGDVGGAAEAASAMTRRAFVQAGSAGVLALAVGAPLLRHAWSAPPGAASSAWLRRSSYTPLRGQLFELSSPGSATVSARLVAIDDLRGQTPSRESLAGRDDAFSLLFRGPSAPRLEQEVLELRHDALGRFSLLVSPASDGDGDQHYSVVINAARD